MTVSYRRQQQFEKPSCKALHEQNCLGDGNCLNRVELHKYGVCVCVRLNVSVLPLLVSLLVHAVWWPGKCKSYF